MSNFWKPKQLQGEYKFFPHFILNLLGALGLMPAMNVTRSTGIFWIGAALFLLWYAVVYLTYLTYCYFKNKKSDRF
jgi:hypothetical protein